MRALLVLVASTTVASADPCLHGGPLLDLARAAMPNAHVTNVRCAPVKAKIPLAFVTFDVPNNIGTPEPLHPALLVANGKVVWTGEPGEICTPCIVRTFSLADVDGDGRDELVVREHKDGHMGYTGSWLDIRRINDDGKPDDVGGYIPLDGHGAKPQWTCTASHRVIAAPRGGKLIEVTRTLVGEPDGPDSCAAGRHLYRFRDGTFEEIR
jgi:hypothetical protein